MFRRQRPVGPYVIDFYCAAARLAVEIDGWGHAAGDRPERDERRDAWLRERGIRTLRIPAVEVMQQCDGTVERVVQAARAAIEGCSILFGAPQAPSTDASRRHPRSSRGQALPREIGGGLPLDRRANSGAPQSPLRF